MISITMKLSIHQRTLPKPHIDILTSTRPFKHRICHPKRLQYHAHHNHRIITSNASSIDSSGDDSPELVAQQLADKLASLDLNQLQTALNNAIAAEDYTLASKIRDVMDLIIQATTTTDSASSSSSDWRSLGILDWLAERAEILGYRLPSEVQKRSTPILTSKDDCIIRSETGSGKTLSFLLPLLSILPYPPQVYLDDMPSPALIVIVPTRELGVQVVMLIYKLFGGSVNQGIPGERANMFHFNGPRGLKVRGLLLEDEVEAVCAAGKGAMLGTHVLVGTPELIGEVMNKCGGGGDACDVLDHCSAVVVDEVDACFQTHPIEMTKILDKLLLPPGLGSNNSSDKNAFKEKPVVALVGATLDDHLVDLAVDKGWIEDPVAVQVGGIKSVPKGLSHRYIVVDSNTTTRLAVLTRAIRADLLGGGEDSPPARVMVFADSEEQAREVASPLRNVLWGEHSISVLLPQGSEPIKALHSFRDNKTTLLLATPAASRGLDLPAVSHVYNLQPPHDAADYLHRAGRAGRIGASVAGVVTTLLSEEEEEGFLDLLGRELGVKEVVKVDAPPPVDLNAEEGDIDTLKRGLEDRFNLM